MAEPSEEIGALRDMVRISRDSFSRERQQQSYPVDRSFYEPTMHADRQEPAVVEELPTFNRRSCESWIKEKVELSQEPVKVLDLGCGTGRALADIVEKHGDRIEPYGITAYRYEPARIPEDQITVGDISHLNKYYLKDNFDIVYSYQAICHTGRHFTNIIRKVYRILKPGGFAFLHITDLSEDYNTVLELNRLQEWLEKNGYEFEFAVHPKSEGDKQSITKCSFRKPEKRRRLLLPVTYNKDLDVCFDNQKADPYSSKLTS